MVENAPIIQKLRQLGLTRTEAEVYLAALQEAADGPVSGYKVAQAMGRDPANLAKTLAALEKQGAVRVVQEKPRLYLPVKPEDFTAGLVARMKDTGSQLVEHLARFTLPQPEGLTLALRDNQQALEQAAQLLDECQCELLISASRDVIDYLGREFGNLASRGDRRVRFLGTEASGIALAEDRIIQATREFSADGPLPWLHMVVDRRYWLTAKFNRSDEQDLPCGWWCDDPALAGLLAMVLDAACGGVSYDQPADVGTVVKEEPQAPEPEEASPTLQGETVQAEDATGQNMETPSAEPTPETRFEGGVMGAVQAAEEPQASPPENPAGAEDDDSEDEEDDGGFEFVVRHGKDDE